MTDHQTGIRLSTAALDRADRLAEALRDDPEASAMGPVTRSGVLRLAIALGLDELERRRGPLSLRAQVVEELTAGPKTLAALVDLTGVGIESGRVRDVLASLRREGRVRSDGRLVTLPAGDEVVVEWIMVGPSAPATGSAPSHLGNGGGQRRTEEP